MNEDESYSPAARAAAWLGVFAAAGLLLICLDVAAGGLLRGRLARYRGVDSEPPAVVIDLTGIGNAP